LEFEVGVILAVTLDDGGEFVLTTVGGEGVFHVSYVEAVVIFTQGFAVDGTVASPVSHSTDLFDVFEDSHSFEFGYAGWTMIRFVLEMDVRYAYAIARGVFKTCSSYKIRLVPIEGTYLLNDHDWKICSA
jgi:hypothetical protein